MWGQKYMGNETVEFGAELYGQIFVENVTL